MNVTFFASHFWFQMGLISFASLLFAWLIKVYVKRTTIKLHSEQAYPYVLNFLSLLLFFVVLATILIDHTFFGLNEKIFSLSQTHFDENYKPFVAAITVFGNYKVIFLAALLTSLWFASKKQWRTFVFWLGNLIVGYGITIVLKNLVKFPRPPAIDPTDVASLYSFPSGHIIRVVLILTFFNMLVSPFITNRQKNINFFIAGSIIILMSLSRLFLDVHWLSDVIGSICLGLACSITAFTLYQRKINPVLPVPTLSVIFFGSWLLSWAIFYFI